MAGVRGWLKRARGWSAQSMERVEPFQRSMFSDWEELSQLEGVPQTVLRARQLEIIERNQKERGIESAKIVLNEEAQLGNNLVSGRSRNV